MDDNEEKARAAETFTKNEAGAADAKATEDSEKARVAKETEQSRIFRKLGLKDETEMLKS